MRGGWVDTPRAPALERRGVGYPKVLLEDVRKVALSVAAHSGSMRRTLPATLSVK